MPIALTISEESFVSLYTILQNVRLGDRNSFEQDLSATMIALGDTGIDDLYNELVDEHGAPDITVDATMDGFSINLV